ncbi:MAG: dipeptidase [Enhygromyxa sp.]
MRTLAFALLLGLGCTSACERSSASTAPPTAAGEDETVADETIDLAARAEALARRFIILDGHIDVPIRVAGALRKGTAAPPVHAHTDEGDFDYERARAGGLDAPFMSIYTPAELESEPGASKAFAEQSVDFVLGLASDHPDKFALALTPAQVRENFQRGLISLAMGMENGSPIEGELANLRHFYDRGIRYITLTHSRDNHICDSSYDTRHTHGGLSPFGREVVAEMNRLGIMIDVSHVSDDSFWQILELSAVPVIASHSSCRAFTPGFERNMSDEMIVALAERGGVIQINFGGGFLSAAFRAAEEQARVEIGELLEEHHTDWQAPEGKAIIAEYRATHPMPRVDVYMVADHIDHVVELAGVDHVGFGSDFDGVGDTLPEGLEDVSRYPNLIRVLLERGYTDADIEKICGANVLRVWQAVEDHGAAHR